jgi:beta-1,4-mannosyl-glycoprotein beta-1,4-N-acetylglucosaminyltransferase
MIYDCFTLRDELDLLELRLDILDSVVDKFVISEANYTHKGYIKPYYFLENIDRFSKWADKIIYLPVDFEDTINDRSINFHNKTEIKNEQWLLENKQRDAVLYGLEECNDSDIILVGDLDEIPNLQNLPKNLNTTLSFVQTFYYYYADNKSIGPKDEYWVGTVGCNYKFLKSVSPQYLRDNRWSFSPYYNGGWHWSYFGGEEVVIKKIESIVEAEYLLNNNNLTMDSALANFKNLKDFYNRNGMNFKLIDLQSEYPKYILDFLKKYPNFVYNKNI